MPPTPTPMPTQKKEISWKRPLMPDPSYCPFCGKEADSQKWADCYYMKCNSCERGAKIQNI
jgi:transcription elongation factor Elf1